MKVGDLVEYDGQSDESNGRQCGIVTAFDRHPHNIGSTFGEPIVEVLWNTGHSWILQARVKRVDESR